MASDAPAPLDNGPHAAGSDDRMPGSGTRRWSLALIVALAVYAILTAVVAIPNCDHINPDGIAYVRNARYLGEGRLLDSVSGYWSPLLSWCVAPLLSLGVDALHASRIVLAVWGAVLVGGAAMFLRRCTAITPPWDLVALVLVGIAASQWVGATDITPDPILGAVLLWYFYFVATPDLLVSRRFQVAAGLLGGLAYLAKSYAFPFFLAHYSLSVLLHYFSRSSSATRHQAQVAWGRGLLAFAMVAGPWIGVLTLKYGTLTVSRAGAFNHYIVGPPDKETNYEVLHRAQPVPPGRLTAWETPEDLDFDGWSPLASRTLLLHQARYLVRNGQRIVAAIAGFDLLAIIPGVLILMPAIRLAAGRRRGGGAFPAVWLLMTVAVFAGGFLPLAFEPRYIEPVLWPLCCAAVFGVVADLRWLLAEGGPGRIRTRAVALIATLCAVSLAAPALETMAVALRPGLTQRTDFRQCGEELAAAGCAGPVAACPGDWHAGLYVAYHASVPFLGEVRADAPDRVERSLGELGARAFVATSKWPMFEEFQRRTNWKAVCRREQDGVTLCVFVKPADDTPPNNR